jgi:hypothetical protein
MAVHDGIIDLYLQVKIRSNDEVRFLFLISIYRLICLSQNNSQKNEKDY